MHNSELEIGLISGKRQTMVSVSSWLAEKIDMARRISSTEDAAMVLELTLFALDTLKEKIDEQLRNGVKTIDCSDFLPE